MLTAMIEAQRLTNERGQAYTIFTNDQQLYRIVVNIPWVYSELFLNFIPRLGGMHALMSFVGAVGTLMIDTGLEPILSVAFGGVSKMLSGKKKSREYTGIAYGCARTVTWSYWHRGVS